MIQFPFRLNLSQEPEIMKLQSRCYEMLTDEEMPSKASKSMQFQLSEMRKAAKGLVILLVLDGESYPRQWLCHVHLCCLQTCGARSTPTPSIVWTFRRTPNSSYVSIDNLYRSLLTSRMFSVKVTTRIKGILDKGKEVVGGSSVH